MRTHYCGELNTAHLDQEVTLVGWAHRRRDHGGVIFVDLRDREGRVQVVFDPDTEQTFATAERVRCRLSDACGAGRKAPTTRICLPARSRCWASS